MINLYNLRNEVDTKMDSFEELISAKFPGLNKFHWFRALSAINGTIGRHNDDTSHDIAMAEDKDIKEAYDSYLISLHSFYRNRDEEGGFLGSRGI